MLDSKFILKLSLLFSINLILFSCFHFSLFSTSKQSLPIKSLNEDFLLINTFDDFNQTIDSEFISSTITSSEISFIYEGTTSEWVTERFMYTFDSLGNCTDYSIEVDVEFSLEDIDDHLNAGLDIGSYFTNNGSFIGAPPIWGDHIHASTYVYDAWDASQATYATALWGYEETDERIASINMAGLSGNVTICQERVGSILTCSFKSIINDSIYFTHTWMSQDYNVNFLSIYVNSRNTNSNISATFTSISGNLSFIENVTPSINPTENPTLIFTGLTYLATTIGIFVTTGLIIYSKKELKSHFQ